jgi:hypothetical protein
MSSESMLSVAVSACALIVSVTALYAQFFRKRARLHALLVDKDFNEHPSWFQYALVNTGDVQILLRKVTCESDHLTFLTQCAQVPCVIAAGDVKLIKLELAPGEHEPAGVHFAVLSAKGDSVEAAHRVKGSGLQLPFNGPYWQLFVVIA